MIKIIRTLGGHLSVRIGIVGGTGGMGRGFAMRWCKKHHVVVGSRDMDRAAKAAETYLKDAGEAYGSLDGTITGAGNVSAAEQCDVLLLSIPYENIDSTCPDVLAAVRDDCTVVSPVVPMTKTPDGFEFIPFKDGKGFAHQMISGHMKNPSRLVSAFHVISEKKLADPKRELDYDIFVCGDDQNSVDVVNGLISEIPGLRPLYLGPGNLAYMAEIATPILLNVMIRNKIRNPGIKIV